MIVPSLYPIVIDSKALDEQFRQLMGDDYGTLAYSMQRFGYEKDHEVNGTAISGGVE